MHSVRYPADAFRRASDASFYAAARNETDMPVAGQAVLRQSPHTVPRPLHITPYAHHHSLPFREYSTRLHCKRVAREAGPGMTRDRMLKMGGNRRAGCLQGSGMPAGRDRKTRWCLPAGSAMPICRQSGHDRHARPSVPILVVRYRAPAALLLICLYYIPIMMLPIPVFRALLGWMLDDDHKLSKWHTPS